MSGPFMCGRKPCAPAKTSPAKEYYPNTPRASIAPLPEYIHSIHKKTTSTKRTNYETVFAYPPVCLSEYPRPG